VLGSKQKQKQEEQTMNKNKKLNKLKKSDLVDLLIALKQSKQTNSVHFRNAFALLKTAKY
jgi:hypothetical protein